MIEPKKLKCDVCGHVRLIRYQCNKCKANLCVKCKEPEFIEKHCPLGHQLVKTKSKFEAECDVCLQSIDKGGQCYTDVICQADLCLSCLV